MLLKTNFLQSSRIGGKNIFFFKIYSFKVNVTYHVTGKRTLETYSNLEQFRALLNSG